MDRNLNAHDQSGDRPDVNFPSATSSQFTQSQYPFPIDTELTMSSNYPALPQTYTQQLHDAANSAKMPTSPSQNNFAINTNGAGNGVATDPAMAPPQTPNQQSFVATASRPNVDDPSDMSQTPMTGDKRKRSKVSRACDECRRKKVRCINPPSEDSENENGIPKTCTNCEKAGLTCGFERKPMKRGPSKGYIKDLADRVHSVEQLQAAALRQSLDIGSTSAPFDQVAFSPEDAPTGRSRLSFSLTHAPFAQAEFQRDRIPSTGAWGSNLPDLRSRDQGSVAIAPDQSLPLPNVPDSNPSKDLPTTTTKPFWADLDQAHPAKRRKIDQPSDNMESFKLNETHLGKYYSHVHPLVGLLPEAGTVIGVIENATAKVSHAFATALELLPGIPRELAVNGDHTSESTSAPQSEATATKTSFKSSVFSSFDELSKWILEQLKDHPADRSDDDNLALAWTCVLIALSLENDFAGIISDPHTSADLLNQTFEVVNYLGPDTLTPADSFIADNEEFLGVVRTAHNVSYMLTTLHSLGSGLVPYLKPGHKISIVNKVPYISPEAAYVCMFANNVEMTLPSLQWEHESLGLYAGEFMKGSLSFNLVHYPLLAEQSLIVRQVSAFLGLLVVRNKKDMSADTIFMAAHLLADILVSKAKNTANPKPYNPLDVHSWTLVTITFLEFMMNSGNPIHRKVCKDIVEILQPLIKDISAEYHKNHDGREWFYAPANGANPDYRTTHWSDSLLNSIKHAKEQEMDEYTWSPDNAIVPAFDRLLRRGYFNVLYLFNGK